MPRLIQSLQANEATPGLATGLNELVRQSVFDRYSIFDQNISTRSVQVPNASGSAKPSKLESSSDAVPTRIVPRLYGFRKSFVRQYLTRGNVPFYPKPSVRP